jgi:hypothetical protein
VFQANSQPSGPDVSGYPSLAAAIIRDAMKHDHGWFLVEKPAVHFWCDVAGISYEAFDRAYDRWRAGRGSEVPSEPDRVRRPEPISLSLYRSRGQR